jgi:hypothetical protein
MNSQSLSRLLQGTYQGLGSQDGIVDLRPPVLSSRDEFKSEPHEPFLIPRSNGRRAPEYTASNLGDRTTSLCTIMYCGYDIRGVFRTPGRGAAMFWNRIVSVHKIYWLSALSPRARPGAAAVESTVESA